VKRTGLKILVIGLTALGLSAGVVAGMLVSRLPAATAGVHPVTVQAAVSLSADLGLSSDQQAQMRQIWEGVRGQVQDCFQKAQGLQQERDDEIVKLLSDDQKQKFANIAKQFHDRDAKISQDRQQLMAQAIEQTRKLLTDEQRQKYDQILKARLGKVPTTGPVAAVFEFEDATGLAREYEIAGGIHD
jgi:Spy/CpxP family protein refolding chaperone